MAAVVAVSCCSTRMPGFFAPPASRGGGSVLRQAYRVSGRLGTRSGRCRAKNPGFLRVGSERARRGKSRASGKARHLGPAARVVMRDTNGSGGCGVVLQHPNAGIFGISSGRGDASVCGGFGLAMLPGTSAGRGARRSPASRSAPPDSRGGGRVLRQAYRVSERLGTRSGRCRAKNPGFLRVGSERARRGKSRASGKARHLGPAARVVMRNANGSGGCGVVLQHPNAGIFRVPASRGGGRVLRQAYRVSERLGTRSGRCSAKNPGFLRVGSERARCGKSRASGKARHLGPAARVVMRIANGSGGCGVVLQHPNAGIFRAPASRGGGSVLRQAYRMSGRLGTRSGRCRAKNPGFLRCATRSRAGNGRSRASRRALRKPSGFGPPVVRRGDR